MGLTTSPVKTQITNQSGAIALILVITHKERNKRTGQVETIVSHGIDLATDRPVILPNETPQSIGAIFDREYGEFVLLRRNQI